eukprot:250744_1
MSDYQRLNDKDSIHDYGGTKSEHIALSATNDAAAISVEEAKKIDASIPSHDTEMVKEETNEQKDETKDSIHDRDESENLRILDTKLAVDYICEIDTSSRTFRCNVEVTLNWAMTEEEEKKIEELKYDDDKLEKYIEENIKCPEVIAGNGRDIDMDNVFMTGSKVQISRKARGGKLQFVSIQNLNGEWEMERDYEELNDFPFDRQPLPVVISTKTCESDRFRILLNTDTDGRETLFLQHNTLLNPGQSQEFDCYMADISTTVVSDQIHEIYYGNIFMMIHAKRKWRYYFNQVVVFVFIQSVLLLPGYAIDVRDVSDRLGYFVTLLLAQTALLYFVADSVPKLTYFSILDEYIMWNFVLTVLCSVQTSIMSVIEDDENAEEVDFWCFIGFCGVLLLINLFYLYDSYTTSKKIDECKYYLESPWSKKMKSAFIKPDYHEFQKQLKKRKICTKICNKIFYVGILKTIIFLICCGPCLFCYILCKKIYHCCCVVIDDEDDIDGNDIDWWDDEFEVKNDDSMDDEFEGKNDDSELLINNKKNEEQNGDSKWWMGSFDEWRGGVCVYYASNTEGLGEYRDWRKENKPFEDEGIWVLDKVVILFGENGTYAAKQFYEQNTVRSREFRERKRDRKCCFKLCC